MQSTRHLIVGIIQTNSTVWIKPKSWEIYDDVKLITMKTWMTETTLHQVSRWRTAILRCWRLSSEDCGIASRKVQFHVSKSLQFSFTSIHLPTFHGKIRARKAERWKLRSRTQWNVGRSCWNGFSRCKTLSNKFHDCLIIIILLFSSRKQILVLWTYLSLTRDHGWLILHMHSPTINWF